MRCKLIQKKTAQLCSLQNAIRFDGRQVYEHTATLAKHDCIFIKIASKLHQTSLNYSMLWQQFQICFSSNSNVHRSKTRMTQRLTIISAEKQTKSLPSRWKQHVNIKWKRLHTPLLPAVLLSRSRSHPHFLVPWLLGVPGSVQKFHKTVCRTICMI